MTRDVAGEPSGSPKRPASRAGFELSLKGRALRYLAAREHSRAELERKLAPHAESPEQLAFVLDELQARDFISDSRVVESVLHRKAARFGAARVRHELLGKGLGGGLVAEAMDRLKSTELERAREVWRRKFGELPATPAERARQIRFLVARGFSTDIAARLLRGQDYPDD